MIHNANGNNVKVNHTPNFSARPTESSLKGCSELQEGFPISSHTLHLHLIMMSIINGESSDNNGDDYDDFGEDADDIFVSPRGLRFNLNFERQLPQYLFTLLAFASNGDGDDDDIYIMVRCL